MGYKVKALLEYTNVESAVRPPSEEVKYKVDIQVQREVQAGDTNLSAISMSMELKAETEKEGCAGWKVRQSGRKERPERWEDSRNQGCPRGREKGAY